MKLEKVPFEVAKDLKDLGFDWETIYFYQYNQSVNELNGWHTSLNYIDKDENDGSWYVTNCYNWNKLNFTKEESLKFIWNDILLQDGFTICCSAPTLDLVCKWLRDVHRISIEPDPSPYFTEKSLKYDLWIWSSIGDLAEDNDLCFDTYEQAQLEGIKEAIKYLKNENN